MSDKSSAEPKWTRDSYEYFTHVANLAIASIGGVFTLFTLAKNEIDKTLIEQALVCFCVAALASYAASSTLAHYVILERSPSDRRSYLLALTVSRVSLGFGLGLTVASFVFGQFK